MCVSIHTCIDTRQPWSPEPKRNRLQAKDRGPQKTLPFFPSIPSVWDPLRGISGYVGKRLSLLEEVGAA